MCRTCGKRQNRSSVIAKEDKDKAVLAIYIAVKEVLPPFITNKTKRISLKVEVSYGGGEAFNRRLAHSVTLPIMA